jgi:hypothetical protein
MLPSFEQDDLAGFAKPARTRRTGGTASHTANNEDTFFRCFHEIESIVMLK